MRTGRIGEIEVRFMNAGGVLFGVKDDVPALMNDVERCGAALDYFRNLVAVDGPGKVATFEVRRGRLRHARRLPAADRARFLALSPVADAEGWVDVDQHTLHHKTFADVLIDGTKPSRPAWRLKERLLPPVYWRAMLRALEWTAKPEPVAAPAA
jgi:sulfide:quinone oxidoreductase